MSRGKRNSDKWCAMPKMCRAKGNGLCRRCSCRKTITLARADPEFRKRQAARSRENIKALFNDPEFRKKHRKAVRENARKLNSNRYWKKNARERMRALANNPVVQAKARASYRKLFRDPVFRASRLEMLKKKFWSSHAIAKRKRSLQLHGYCLSAADHMIIAMTVGETNKTYAEIGADWLISGSHVGVIARKHGVARGKRVKRDGK